MQSNLKYTQRYDRKANAALLKPNDCCFLLQPIANHQGSKFSLREMTRIGLSIVEKLLPNENYIVSKLCLDKTMLFHRICLQTYVPNTILQDERPEQNLLAGDEIIIPHDDRFVIAWIKQKLYQKTKK